MYKINATLAKFVLLYSQLSHKPPPLVYNKVVACENWRYERVDCSCTFSKF